MHAGERQTEWREERSNREESLKCTERHTHSRHTHTQADEREASVTVAGQPERRTGTHARKNMHTERIHTRKCRREKSGNMQSI